MQGASAPGEGSKSGQRGTLKTGRNNPGLGYYRPKGSRDFKGKAEAPGSTQFDRQALSSAQLWVCS